MKDDVFNAYAKTRYATPLWSVVTYCHFLGSSYSLNEPNSVSIFTNASLRAIQVFNVCITQVNLIAAVGAVNVLIDHHLISSHLRKQLTLFTCVWSDMKAKIFVGYGMTVSRDVSHPST